MRPGRLQIDLLREALRALSANRLRTGLTLLGLVIGVASVVLMLGIGEGSRERVAESIASLGSDQLIINAGGGATGPLRGSAGTLPSLSLDDLEAVAELAGVRAVAPVHSVQMRAVAGAQNKNTQLVGSSVDYLAVQHWPLQEGRNFTATEARSAAGVALIGVTVLRELFPDLPQGASVLGQQIRLQRQSVEIIGVLAAKGQGFGGQDQDDLILMPVHTVQRRLAGSAFPGTVGLGLVSVEGAKPAVEAQIQALLRQRHRLSAGAEDDFSIRDMAALSASLALVSQVLSLLLGAIALISLLVGGIGVMNIMLVSVSERTREIGLRMALGASSSAICAQFLWEAAWLSAVGAACGLALGLGLGMALEASGSLHVVIKSWSLLTSVGVALTVGMGFGWWPAQRAAALLPSEALRSA
ncbi:putative ABC transport system permease protein [Inhella inkyongensis]|uniref:Putative ABC transport system permease protein n=1 Tax=Inhella inkyongensis TaxID=392593 RepID=A0A840S4P3_9BURK|nr:ABC transporter permease [Inhella inkyongensis]MBB5203794.1 putative ABC transport system permease protein [Inhella inkyongensis]